ncbi:uncharacterized protein LOC135461446 [Liolophura sinensis]|uniref:uncharacterized protein LOC135461446 n=1 Tax=Liolophura sinensis TaxID=3198878 RepID=UPI0031597A75
MVKFSTCEIALNQVVRKTREYVIGKREAEVRVMIDRMVAAKGGEDQALLFVLSQESLSTQKLDLFTNILLHRGANPSVCDSHMQTPLHHAAKRNLVDVCRRLLENDALPNVKDRKRMRPLSFAVKNSNDQIGAMLLEYMSNKDVRSLFLADGDTPAEFSCETLLRKNMEETMMSLMNCMIDRHGHRGKAKVYYNVLESDSHGRPPSHHRFDRGAKSVLYHITNSGNKTIIYHEAVRLLVRKRWKDHMKFRFLLSATFYLLTLFSLVYSAVVVSSVPDPMVYDSPLQISRGVFEVIAYSSVAFTFLLELNQFRRHRLQYWKDLFNWLDMSSTILILAVLPLRFTYQQAQWHVFSVGFMLWTFKIFKYSIIFRQTGAYTHILWRVLSYDIVQFMMFFVIILLAFSGAFVLALRGDNSLKVSGQQRNASDPNEPTLFPESAWESSSTFWWILFLGFRTLIDTEPLVEDYIKLPPLSVILIIVFMFLCIVVMLNLLIAQLSDTYQNIQSDAHRGLELNRAWIVTRMEINSVFMGNYRVKQYTDMEEFDDVQDVLAKWDSPPLNSIHTKLKRVEELAVSTHSTQTTLLQRLAWQEHALLDIQNRLAAMAAGRSADGKTSGSGDAPRPSEA